MATTKIDIIKRAASHAGEGSLVTIEDNAEVSRLMDESYEAIVEEAFTQHGWKFARKAGACQLTELTPEKPWAQVWRKPVGLLSLQYVCDDQGLRVEHEERETTEGRSVVTLYELENLNAVGTYRVDEDSWPADFAMGVQHKMEAVFLAGIAEQREQASDRERMGEIKFQRARARDQRASTPTDPGEWDLAAARNRRAAWAPRSYRAN